MIRIRMNKRTKLTRAAVTAALALLFAGSAAATAASAFGAAVSGAALYAAAIHLYPQEEQTGDVTQFRAKV